MLTYENTNKRHCPGKTLDIKIRQIILFLSLVPCPLSLVPCPLSLVPCPLSLKAQPTISPQGKTTVLRVFPEVL